MGKRKEKEKQLCNICFENRTNTQVLISQNGTRQKGHIFSRQNLSALLRFCEAISPKVFVFC